MALQLHKNSTTYKTCFFWEVQCNCLLPTYVMNMFDMRRMENHLLGAYYALHFPQFLIPHEEWGKRWISSRNEEFSRNFLIRRKPSANSSSYFAPKMSNKPLRKTAKNCIFAYSLPCALNCWKFIVF